MLSACGRQPGHGRSLSGASFVERGVGGQHGGPRLLGGHGRRHPPRPGLVHLVLGHELLGEQRLEPREVVFSVPELGVRTMERGLRCDPLRLQARDLGIRGDGVGLTARDVCRRGIELRHRARDAGVGGGDAVA